MRTPLICRTEEDLITAGESLARELQAGAVVALKGDLGAGKTHFTKGIARQLGCQEVVTSPTFSLVQEHHDGRLPLFHFDFYRLKSEAELFQIGWDDYLEGMGIVVAEWADLFPAALPASTIGLEILKIEEGRLLQAWQFSQNGCT